MLLGKLVPEYDFGEVHSTRFTAPPERALEEIKLANLGEMPLVRLLFAVRSIPACVGRKRGLPSEKAEPLYEQMLEFGFVLLAEEPGRELVFGGMGQMFKASGGLTPLFRDADGFVAFGEPGYAKVAMNKDGPGSRISPLTWELRRGAGLLLKLSRRLKKAARGERG